MPCLGLLVRKQLVGIKNPPCWAAIPAASLPPRVHLKRLGNQRTDQSQHFVGNYCMRMTRASRGEEGTLTRRQPDRKSPKEPKEPDLRSCPARLRSERTARCRLFPEMPRPIAYATQQCGTIDQKKRCIRLAHCRPAGLATMYLTLCVSNTVSATSTVSAWVMWSAVAFHKQLARTPPKAPRIQGALPRNREGASGGVSYMRKEHTARLALQKAKLIHGKHQRS